jgi:hypothetical protein
MHEVPDLDAPKGSNGVRRMVRYDQLTSHLLGPVRGKWCLLPFQLSTCVGIAILYVVAGGQDLHGVWCMKGGGLRERERVLHRALCVCVC